MAVSLVFLAKWQLFQCSVVILPAVNDRPLPDTFIPPKGLTIQMKRMVSIDFKDGHTHFFIMYSWRGLVSNDIYFQADHFHVCSLVSLYVTESLFDVHHLKSFCLWMNASHYSLLCVQFISIIYECQTFMKWAHPRLENSYDSSVWTVARG